VESCGVPPSSTISPYTYSGSKSICYANCSQEFSHLYTHPTEKNCYDICPNNMFAYPANMTCIEGCEAPLFKYSNQTHPHVCYERCPSGKFIMLSSNSCTDVCDPQLYETVEDICVERLQRAEGFKKRRPTISQIQRIDYQISLLIAHGDPPIS
jgi:hypothetical protein